MSSTLQAMYSRSKKAWSKKGKRAAQARLRFCVIHFGDILWRCGVGASVIPYGPEVDEVTKQFQALLGGKVAASSTDDGDSESDGDESPPPSFIFCSASVIEDQSDIVGRSRLIEFTDSAEHPGWEVPHDIFTSAVTSVFEASAMVGRFDTRKALSHSLEQLLLINASSTTLLEALAGFGKSMLANEIVQVSRARESAQKKSWRRHRKFLLSRSLILSSPL
jgi:hypothetical protein